MFKAELQTGSSAQTRLHTHMCVLSCVFLFRSTPSVPLDLQEVEGKIEGFKTFTKKMDENIVIVNTTINEFARKQAIGFKKEYQKVGQSFRLLAQAFELDQQAYSAGLNRAIADTGDAYEAIGEYFAEQPRQDLDPISDLLDLYRGHLANFPDIVHVQKGEIPHTHFTKTCLLAHKTQRWKFFGSGRRAKADSVLVSSLNGQRLEELTGSVSSGLSRAEC